MRITFVCAALEPGADGVGDYTSRLASELADQGHAVQLLALNDPFVETPTRDRPPVAVRLPEASSWAERAATAQEEITAFGPDWLSLQFVCYGWNRKGFVAPAIGTLVRLSHGRPLHLMFHETWIGQMRGAKLSHRVFGAIQRGMIGFLTRRLRPAAVHTTNAAYQALLAQIGVTAEILPLFGNVPVAALGTAQLQPDAWSPEVAALLEGGHDRWWLVALFGSLYPGWQAEPLMTRLKAAAQQSGKRVCIVGLGRMSAGGESLWNDLVAKYRDDFRFVHLGELPPRGLSQVFQAVDFGISNAPPIGAAKSGATVGMLEHGLPVVVCESDLAFRDPTANRVSLDPQMLPADATLPDRMARAAKVAPASRLPAVACEMLNRLQRVT